MSVVVHTCNIYFDLKLMKLFEQKSTEMVLIYKNVSLFTPIKAYYIKDDLFLCQSLISIKLDFNRVSLNCATRTENRLITVN